MTRTIASARGYAGGSLYNSKVISNVGLANIFSYHPLNDAPGSSTARDMGPNGYTGVHNNNPICGLPGPDANTTCTWYQYSGGVPAYTNIGVGTFLANFPRQLGSMMAWFRVPAFVHYRGVVDSATSTTLTDADLIGRLVGTAADWVLLITSGTGSGNNGSWAQCSSFNNVTGEITITDTWAVTPDTTSVYALYNINSCGYAKQTTGGKPVIVSTNNAQNGVITQLEVLNSKMTGNYLAAGTEQQGFTDNLFLTAVDPGWACHIVTWSKAADRVNVYRNGVLVTQPAQPMTGLGDWVTVPDFARIGSQNTTGTFVTSKHWHGGIADVMFGTTEWNQSLVTLLSSRT